MNLNHEELVAVLKEAVEVVDEALPNATEGIRAEAFRVALDHLVDEAVRKAIQGLPPPAGRLP